MYDVLIIGSGIVGLVNALLLAKHTTLRIALVDAEVPKVQWSEKQYDSRVYAITPASQQSLTAIDVWPLLTAKRVSPFTHMQVWDANGGSELRFDHKELNVPALGFIVEENLIRSTLLHKLKDYPELDFFSPLTFTGWTQDEEGISLLQEKGETLRAKLVIGADGAQSWVREQADLALKQEAYQHSALIAQVETSLPHQKTARQVFLSGSSFPSGPLAFLPLQDPQQSSIVWSTTPEAAAELLKLDDSAFQVLLGEAFSLRLGKIRSVSKRFTFPLIERHAERYIKNRVALIGDAAHTLHPLAGQGLNLGIADATYLAEILTAAVDKGRDFASVDTLRRYERGRKGTNALMLSAVKLIKAGFGSEQQGLVALRNQGLKLTNRLTPLKNFFARHAMGFV